MWDVGHEYLQHVPSVESPVSSQGLWSSGLAVGWSCSSVASCIPRRSAVSPRTATWSGCSPVEGSVGLPSVRRRRRWADCGSGVGCDETVDTAEWAVVGLDHDHRRGSNWFPGTTQRFRHSRRAGPRHRLAVGAHVRLRTRSCQSSTAFSTRGSLQRIGRGRCWSMGWSPRWG